MCDGIRDLPLELGMDGVQFEEQIALAKLGNGYSYPLLKFVVAADNVFSSSKQGVSSL